jgi:hypothetical protein
MNPQNEKCVCEVRRSRWPRTVAAHPAHVCFRYRVTSLSQRGEAPFVVKSHVYIQLWGKEVLHHIEEHVTHNPLKTKLVYILFKNPVRTSKRTPPFTITKINWLMLYPLKTKLVYILFKNPVRTSKRTPTFTIKKINWLMLFKEIIAAYSENHT